MAGDVCIEQRMPISKPGTQACGPSDGFLPCTGSCKRSLRVNTSWTGRRNKFLHG